LNETVAVEITPGESVPVSNFKPPADVLAIIAPAVIASVVMVLMASTALVLESKVKYETVFAATVPDGVIVSVIVNLMLEPWGTGLVPTVSVWYLLFWFHVPVKTHVAAEGVETVTVGLLSNLQPDWHAAVFGK
jgi:hypothetical protein